jgi:hypothetical protein
MSAGSEPLISQRLYKAAGKIIDPQCDASSLRKIKGEARCAIEGIGRAGKAEEGRMKISWNGYRE